MAEVKFCGLTRPEDALHGAALGAAYLGVIFAGGLRRISTETARRVLAGTAGVVRRVGVFGSATPDEIGRMADEASLDIVQLHADPDAAMVRRVRAVASRPVWGVVRIRGAEIPHAAAELFAEADAVLLDARVEHSLGGSGVTLAWSAIAEAIEALRGPARLVLAGGLSPDNVAGAIAALAPDVVDVSSGVESSPGIKDHNLMRAFIGAARSTPRAA